MRWFSLFVLLLPLSLGCKEQVQTVFIKRIDFKVKATEKEKKIFEGDYIYWASLHEPEIDLGRLVEADTVLLSEKKVRVRIDYPLGKPVVIELQSDDGFSRRVLLEQISAEYKKIYAEEAAASKVKVVPREKRKGLVNRNETKGKYNICCHDLSDLDLSSIAVYETTDGVLLQLQIES